VQDLVETNRRFYDSLWHDAEIVRPERFNTWPLAQMLVGAPALEVGPGLRPRLSFAGTVFVEPSRPAVERLRASGARALVGDVRHLPFRAASFAAVGAFDIVEHLEDDDAVFAELSRVLRPGGCLVLSVPLHSAAWTEFDELVGHCRRYDPPVLERMLAEHGLGIDRSAVYGMQPSNPWLLNLGVRMLRRHRARAMFWYNRVFLPLALWRQKPLQFVSGLVNAPRVDEIIAVCRRAATA
jgi:SAM-dependent methyltransferase